MALGKAIQTNKTLTSLVWDDNGTQTPGFQSFLVGLTRNSSIKNMPLPITDISLVLFFLLFDNFLIIGG